MCVIMIFYERNMICNEIKGFSLQKYYFNFQMYSV